MNVNNCCSFIRNFDDYLVLIINYIHKNLIIIIVHKFPDFQEYYFAQTMDLVILLFKKKLVSIQNFHQNFKESWNFNLKQTEFNCKFIHWIQLIDPHHCWFLRFQQHLPDSFFLSCFECRLWSYLQSRKLQSHCLDHIADCTLQLRCLLLLLRTCVHF